MTVTVNMQFAVLPRASRAAQTTVVMRFVPLRSLASARNDALLGALVQHLQPGTHLAIASGLTLPQARCEMRAVQAWRAKAGSALGDRLPVPQPEPRPPTGPGSARVYYSRLPLAAAGGCGALMARSPER